jgi:hypothetical protein
MKNLKYEQGITTKAIVGRQVIGIRKTSKT